MGLFPKLRLRSSMNEKEICFIMCTNNQTYMEEAVNYISHLQVPEGYTISFLAVEDAKSMTAGYNEGMSASSAKYKVYLHQDTFIVNPRFIADCLKIFEMDEQIGMIGMIGIPKMPKSGIMWGGKQYGMVYESHLYETVIRGNSIEDRMDTENSIEEDNITETLTKESAVTASEQYLEVEAADGLLLMTQYDLPWREDIFDKWDFYDASQCMEFIRKGYKVVVPRMEKPWVLHDCGLLNKENYDTECEKYKREYL